MRRRASRYTNRLTAVSCLTPQAKVPAFIQSSLVKPRATLQGDAALAQMAEDMRQNGQREGGVTDRDLELLGWTTGQVKLMAMDANRRAQALAGATV